MKRCSTCTEYKPESEFYVRDKETGALYGQCIQCKKNSNVNGYYAKRQERIEQAKKYQQENQQAHVEANRRWMDKNASTRRFMAGIYKDQNPEKVKAHQAVAYALKTGYLKKPDHCQACGKKKPIQGHHDDYSKPLVVRWLCISCHMQHHREEQ